MFPPKTVAYLDRQHSDEILAIRHEPQPPVPGQLVTLEPDEADGEWEVSLVQPLPGSPKFDYMVYLDRR